MFRANDLSAQRLLGPTEEGSRIPWFPPLLRTPLEFVLGVEQELFPPSHQRIDSPLRFLPTVPAWQSLEGHFQIAAAILHMQASIAASCNTH